MDTQYNKRECSFTPEISKQSRRLVKKREHNKEFKKVEDRLLGYIKKNKTASLAQTSQPSICQQRTSIDQRAATCNLSILETKDNEGFSPKKEQNNKVVCVMQDEMEAVYKSLPKIDKFEDCNKELMFSFKKFLNSTNQDLPKSTDRETSHEYLKYGPHKGDLIFESDKAFESTESRDFEKERELILKNRKEELRKRKEEKLKEEVSRNKSKPRELSFRALKRSTLSPLREVAPDLNGGYTGANKKSGPEDLAQPTSITSNEETKPKKVPARKSTRTRSTTPTPKPGVHTSIEQTKQEVKVASRHAHLKEAPSLDRPSTGLHKPNRNEMIEKYGVKVKQPNLECSEIQQTVFAGDTTSMLQNLKKLNTNLRMCSNLQCIIKKKDQLVGTENAPVTTKLGGVPIKEQKENLKAPANALYTKFSERGSHDRNPFIELVNSQVHKPFN